MKNKESKKSKDKVKILGTSTESNISVEDLKILRIPQKIENLKLKIVSIGKKLHRINYPTQIKNLTLYLFRLVVLTHLVFGFMCIIMSSVTLWRLTLFLNIPFFYLISWLFGFVISALLIQKRLLKC